MSENIQQGVIYKITNIINGKLYIGKRKFNREKFLTLNYFGSGKLIKLAIKKYGIKNFNREILIECDYSILDNKEKEYIAFYKSLIPNGYNIGKGGEGNNGGANKGKKWTKEHKEKISKSRKGKCLGDKNPMKRLNVRCKFFNHPVSKKTRDKIRLKHLGIKNTKRHNKNISIGFKKLYKNGYINNRKGWRKIGGKWYEPKISNNSIN